MTVERCDERNEMVRADQIKAGDLLNLQPDCPYFDGEEPAVEFELCAVLGVERYGPDDVGIFTDQVNFTCPADYEMHRAGRDTSIESE